MARKDPPTLPRETIDRLVKEYRYLAEAAHAQYPQYQGHWSGPEWVLVQVVRKVRTKLGVAFEKWDLAIAKRDTLEGKSVWSVYSTKNRVDTVLDSDSVVEVNPL